MRPQVWCGKEKPSISEMRPVDASNTYFGKPKGGFWTSPLRNNSSPWIEYCKDSGFSDFCAEKCWVLTPEANSKILKLSNPKDLRDLKLKKDNMLDYDIIFPEYDAVYIKPNILNHSIFRDYDCETILWNKWKFEDIILLDKYNK